MRLYLAFYAILASCSCFAHTNTTYFTNRFASFTNLQGRYYENVELMRLDSLAITYRQQGGGGRVYLTNLSVGTLQALGLATNLGAQAAKLDREIADQKALSESEEKARMRDPKNWRQVRVLAVFRWWDDRLECQISEMPKRVLLRRPPAGLLSYFTKRGALIDGLYASEAEKVKARAQAAQLQNNITIFAAQLKQRQYQLDIADANTPTGAGGDPAYVNAVIARRSEINTAQVNLNADIERLAAFRDQLTDLTNKVSEMQAKADDYQKQIKDLDAKSSEASVVKVFITSKRHHDFPILECSHE